MQDFEAMVMPNDNFKGKTIIPDQRPKMKEWFELTGAATNVKTEPIVDRHVFDVKRFNRKPKRVLTFLNLFRTL